MQTLMIRGELLPPHYNYIKLSSDTHEWRIESYGVWWKKINARAESCIPFTRIYGIDLGESKD
jgi:hypothetical protein